MIMNSVNSLIFFNGGILSGASQKHKHFQSVPIEGNLTDFGLIKYLEKAEMTYLERNDSYDVCQLPIFTFDHVFIKYSQSTVDHIKAVNLESAAESANFLTSLYRETLSFLEVSKEEPEITTNYSFLMTSQWMLVVPRKSEYFEVSEKKFFGNSLVYMLTILSYEENAEELLREVDFIDSIKML